jgi:hypothetical protein
MSAHQHAARRWVWIVEPENLAVLVFRFSTDFQPCDAQDILLGEGMLEGFTTGRRAGSCPLASRRCQSLR